MLANTRKKEWADISARIYLELLSKSRVVQQHKFSTWRQKYEVSCVGFGSWNSGEPNPLINSREHSRGVKVMSRLEGRGGFLNLASKVLGAVMAIFGGLVVYYSYNTPISVVDPKWVAPLGLFLIGIGGFMLLAKVK